MNYKNIWPYFLQNSNLKNKASRIDCQLYMSVILKRKRDKSLQLCIVVLIYFIISVSLLRLALFQCADAQTSRKLLHDVPWLQRTSKSALSDLH